MQLSAGYQSLIWMVFHIAHRMAVLNPAKMQDVVQTSGVNTSMSVYQGTQEVSGEVQKQINDFYNAMDDEEYIRAKSILEELERTTAPTHPLLVELRTRYEFETSDWEN